MMSEVYVKTDLGNGLTSNQRQASTWTNTDFYSTGPL